MRGESGRLVSNTTVERGNTDPARPPKMGEVVRVRSRRYLVEDVQVPRKGTQSAIADLSCLDDDAQGQKLSVLWNTEIDAEVIPRSSWDDVAKKGFDSARVFGAYLNTLRWNLVTSTNPDLFQAPYRAGIEVMSFQLEPLRKALALPRVNLFIADDVGLGKTIEAGLILRELLIRQKVRRVVVAAPPSVVLQWQQELDQRFGLPFIVFDRRYVQRQRRERGYGVNPWNTHSRFIVSHALLRDEEYAAPLRDWLGGFAPQSLFILDEAHNAAPASGSSYAVDSRLTRIVREVARRFEHRLFLSATPHNGHSNSFSSLLEILDPQRFCRGVPVDGARELEPVMVRRLKNDLRELGVGGFPKRDVVAIHITGLPKDAPELRLAELLEHYRELREAKAGSGTKTQRRATALVVISLQKRLLSSVEAFACSLRHHRKGLERANKVATLERANKVTTPAPQQMDLLNPPGADDDIDDVTEEQQLDDDRYEMEEASAAAGANASTKEQKLLDEMTEIAEAARHRIDPKLGELIGWIKKHMCARLPEVGKKPTGTAPTWNDKRLLIFTEWLDTKRYLEQRLKEAVSFTDRAEERIAVFHGGMGDETREEIKRAFNASPAEHPLRILIATDSAREGVNLQNHCADLFHFDLPWNPSRLEQRNGRIDRKLQPSPEVRCHYFVFDQRPEDKVLTTLVKKTERIQKELGSLSQVLENKIALRLEADGIRRAKVDELAHSIDTDDVNAEQRETVSREFESSRTRKVELEKSLERLRDLKETSQLHLGLEDAVFCDVLSCSLEMLGAEPLKETSVDGDTKAWAFPALDQRIAADPTWAPTLDTLRAPRRRDQKLWDWRKESPVRSVVFEDTGRLDSNTVHLHLEHRVVQRLLGRFAAQGFVHEDLARANVMMTRDAIRRVVLIGRLVIYGDGASRLHEELIPVAARWKEPDLRKGGLSPSDGAFEHQSMELLYASFKEPRLHKVTKDLQHTLAAGTQRDVDELLPTLETRGEAARAAAEAKLKERGEKEAQDMLAILDRQRASIIKRQKEVERDQKSLQQKLPFKELEQLKAETDYWGERLDALKVERKEEPDRIRQSYAVKLWRVDPVGIVYLWPVSG